MSFTQVNQKKASDHVVEQIEKLILHGVLGPNEKLPAERDLAQQLDVSRPVLREALAVLKDKDLIVSKAGSGVYVADFLSNAFAPALVELFTSHEEAHSDFLKFRRDIEAMAAERAARFGLAAEHDAIDRVFRQLKAARDAGDRQREYELDADFHMAIMEAAQNLFMVHMFRSMFDMLRRGVFFNRSAIFQDDTTSEELFAQHSAIHTAILTRDGAAARAAMETHLDYIETTMRKRYDQARKEEVVALRTAHRKYQENP
ncbi:MAG: FadR/GntR family transcriptional regulator [Pseudomonadota bacterium]